MSRRRDFGNLRTLQSGRIQARYTDPSGRTRSAAFNTRRQALTWLADAAVQLDRRMWRDPDAGRELFGVYARAWIDARVDIKPTTHEMYSWVLRKFLLPHWDRYALEDITSAGVRSWYANMVRTQRPTPTRASYALLRTILNTAVDDELIMRNPCRIKGAGAMRHPERPIATVTQVSALADAVFPRYRMLILVAAWTGARWGELIAMTWDRLDLTTGQMRIDRQYVLLRGKGLRLETPKTAAGRRVVHIPPHLLADLRRHRIEFVPTGCELVFPNSLGEPLRRSSFEVVWRRARKRVGLPNFHFHDLRHTGNTLAAQTGASTKELMARMGHASMRAALIYQHATPERDAALAVALSELAAKLSAPVAERELRLVDPVDAVSELASEPHDNFADVENAGR